MNMKWDPDCYNKFKNERLEPFKDLLKLVNVREGMSVIDLGCGTGEITKKLAEILPGCMVTGIDSSPEMLKWANIHVCPALRFELKSIEDISGKWDLIFSNAAIHWIENHKELIAKLYSFLEQVGQLIVQVPSSHEHLTQRLIKKVSGQEPFYSALNGWERTSPVLTIQEYSQILYELGAKDIVVLEKVYPHILKDADELVKWVRGTALIPYLDRLPDNLHDEFLGKYREEIYRHFRSRPLLFPFKRILFSAFKGEEK